MADITIGGLPLATSVNDSDITHIQSGGEDKRVSIESMSKNLPIGFIYTQYPNKNSPSELGLVGTWTNISSLFAGNFFRAEGGNSSSFESGIQSDAMQRVTGSVSNLYVASGSVITDSGALKAIQAGSNNAPLLSSGTRIEEIEFDNADSISPNTAKTDDTETRPINETIRIWERTA